MRINRACREISIFPTQQVRFRGLCLSFDTVHNFCTRMYLTLWINVLFYEPTSLFYLYLWLINLLHAVQFVVHCKIDRMYIGGSVFILFSSVQSFSHPPIHPFSLLRGISVFTYTLYACISILFCSPHILFFVKICWFDIHYIDQIRVCSCFLAIKPFYGNLISYCNFVSHSRLFHFYFELSGALLG